jgi:hypothetical protein
MKNLVLITILVAGSAASQNLTREQKELDFRYMAALYNAWYAPLDWKKELLHFDALDIQPWLQRVAATASDLEFYDVCVDYVASLQDTHAGFILPSDFVATLGFSTDIFDGVVLIDSINRTALPVRDFPFAVGDEVVSVDGVNAAELISRFVKYSPQGNPRSARRLAAARISVRPQSRMPFAPQVGDSAPPAEWGPRDVFHTLDEDGHAAYSGTRSFTEGGHETENGSLCPRLHAGTRKPPSFWCVGGRPPLWSVELWIAQPDLSGGNGTELHAATRWSQRRFLLLRRVPA